MPELELHETWAQRLREQRTKQGLTQRDLSTRSGVSQQAVSKLERGAGGGQETRQALARALGAHPTELFPAYREDLAADAPTAVPA